MHFKEKIRVLYCLHNITTGGVEKRRLLLSEYLSKDDYQLKITCTEYRGKIADDIQRNGMEIISIGKFDSIFDLKAYLRLIKVIRAYKPHIIHGAVFEGVVMACVAGFITRVPVIIAEETSDPKNRNKRASMLLKAITLVADKVIAIAPSVAGYLRDVAKISSRKIHLINNGVFVPKHIDQLQIDELKRQYNILPGDIVIGSVGRLYNDHKRFTDLIKAIAILPNNKHLKLVIAGSGLDEQLLIDTAANLGLAQQLILTGYQADTAPYYAIMDIFCLASQREGFGLVAAEAMLHKLPVVATRVGGLKDVVVDQETGFLVPPLSPDALAEKIGILLADPNLRQRFGKAGYERAFKEYTADVYSAKVDALYKELIANKAVLN